jgi:hypothetical protein
LRDRPSAPAAIAPAAHHESRSFLNASAADVVARVHAAVTTATGGPMVVQVGDEGRGFRNVGVDLPRARRSARESRFLRHRVWTALERERTAAPAGLKCEAPAPPFARQPG